MHAGRTDRLHCGRRLAGVFAGIGCEREFRGGRERPPRVKGEQLWTTILIGWFLGGRSCVAGRAQRLGLRA